MKYLLTILFLIAPVFNEIAEINKHKREAREAYVNGEYEVALSHYSYLVDSLGVNEPEVLLNLGNTYYKLQDTTAAMMMYARLYNNGERDLQSIANQQNGILLNQSKKPEQALEYFKQALKNDPTNEDARYNYELLKKVLKQQEEEQQDQENQEQEQNEDQEQQQNQDQEQQQNQDQQNKENQEQQESDQESDQKKEDKEGEESDKQDENSEDSEEKENSDKQKEQQEGKEGEQQDQEDQESQDDQLNSINEKLKDMKISEEKARMILEAMKNNEIQYFQQNKRKPTKKVDPSKPDW